VLTDVSEERIASIFRVEDKNKSANERAGQVHSHRRENLKSYNIKIAYFSIDHSI
jgi:hypothetical protein